MSAKADNLLPKKINIQNGLTSNTVHTVFTDQSKLTWIGTSTGTFLYKNGIVFPFLHNNLNPIQNCTDIIESNDHSLWFATNGLGVFKYYNKKLYNFTVKNGLVNDKVNTVFSKDDFIYIGTQNGLSIYNTNFKKIINPNFEHFKKFKEFNILQFLVINNQVYFITQNDGVFKITNENHTPRIIKIRNHEYSNTFFIWKNQVYLAEKNNVAVYSIFEFINNQPPLATISIDNVSDFSDDGSQLIAVSQKLYYNKGGIYIIQKDNSYKEYTTYQKLLSQSFNSISINNNQECAFVGTENDGLLIFDLDTSKRYFNTNNLVVQDIQPFKNNILILTEEDIQIRNLYGSIQFKITNLTVQSKLFNKINYVKPLQFLKAEIVEDTIYVKTNIGILKLNKDLKKIDLITTMDYPILIYKNDLFAFNKLHKDDTDNKLLGKLFTEEPDKLPHSILQAVTFGDDIVVSTKNFGLYIIKNNKSFPVSNISNFKNDQIKYIKKNVNNRLLVVTNFNEIYELDPSENYNVSYNFTDKRLKGKNIFFADSYKENHVIGTDVGIEFLSKKEHLILGKEYGLYLPDNITANLIGNILYIGGNGGYYEFDIDRFLKYRNKVNSLKITSIQTLKNNILEEVNLEGLSNNKLYVTSDQVPLYIKILPLCEDDTSSFLYRYKINENSGWSEFSSDPTIHILSFLSSSYSIKIEVFDTISQKLYAFNLVTIKVKDSYLYFKILLGVLGGIGICCFFVFKYSKSKKTQTLIKENDAFKISEDLKNKQLLIEDAEDVSIETKMLLNSINSHFIFNILNFYNYLILDVKTKEALKYSTQFSNFIRCLLKNGMSKYSSLDNEIEFIKAYLELEKYRYNFEINFKVSVDENLDSTEIFLPSFILHPILETIINYSFNENNNTESVFLEIIELNAENIEIKYTYTGKSLQNIDLTTPNRFNKGLLLLTFCRDKYFNKNENLIHKIEDNLNVVLFKINV